MPATQRDAMMVGQRDDIVRMHALDPEGLRLFDTVEIDFVVTGETRDYGLVSLEHEWIEGRGP